MLLHYLVKIEQEGQHVLTGQCAANFRLLANQWAKRRLMTQWHHGCHAIGRSVCNAGASSGGRFLCVQISRERSYPLPIYWYHLKGNWSLPLTVLYNETLQQTFHPLLSKLSRRRQILVIYPHFEEVRGGIEPWLMACWKARIRLPVHHNWTFFPSSYRWGATRQNVSRLAAIRRG